MVNKHLATYLNDHLAGSVTAVKLLERLETPHNGVDVVRFATEMRAEISADQDELKTLMRRLSMAQSLTRRTMAWLAQKLTNFKLVLDDPTDEGLRVFEALEFVEIGIEGKRALWRALAIAAEQTAELQGIDYERLTQRARDQHQRVETMRLEVARKALASEFMK